MFLYALAHSFIDQVIEGDELYTKVGKNVPVEECEGWTIVLMDRASRFIWDLKCGKKDRTLFFHSIQLLRLVIEQTEDLTLVTDGERRYGNILFEICNEVIRSGKCGRAPKVLREGVNQDSKIKVHSVAKNGVKSMKHPIVSILIPFKISMTRIFMPILWRHSTPLYGDGIRPIGAKPTLMPKQ